MNTHVFDTPRLLARRLEHSDLDMLHAVYGDRDTVRWVGDGEPLDRTQCSRWIDVTHRNYETRGYGMLVLVARDSGAVAGFGGLVHPGGQQEAEVKYALRPEYRGRGLATEAAAGLLAYGAREFGLRLVIATVDPDNAASQRVLLKAGMRPGPLRRDEDGAMTQLFDWRPPVSSHAPTA